MNPSALTEAQLDTELAVALRENAKFAQWFIEQTRFNSQHALCVFCREDNPWSTIVSERPNPGSGVPEKWKMGRETDVLAVYETSDGRRLGLHIENKLEKGFFTPHQPESYQERLNQWRLKKNLGTYSEATSVLVAPRAFYERNLAGSKLFESFVSYEDIGQFISAFKRSSASSA